MGKLCYQGQLYNDMIVYAANLTDCYYNNCIFKSCQIIKSANSCVFENCIFESCKIMTTLYKCTFKNCKFLFNQTYKSNWIDCVFDTCIFNNCKIQKMNVSDSHLDCRFNDCFIDDLFLTNCKSTVFFDTTDIRYIAAVNIDGRYSASNITVTGVACITMNMADNIAYHIENTGYIALYYKTVDIRIDNVIKNKGMCLVRLQNYVTLQCTVYNKGVLVQETNYLTCNKCRVVVTDEQQMFQKNIDVLLRPLVLKYINTGRKFVPKLVINQQGYKYSNELIERLTALSASCYADYENGRKTLEEIEDILLSSFLGGVRDSILRENTVTV